jgi:hypothetical protein
MSDPEKPVTGKDIPKELTEKLVVTITDKLAESLAEADVDVEPIELDDISAEVSAIVKDIVANDAEFKKILRNKLVATVEELDPKTAARHAEATLGEAVASILKTIVGFLQPRE